MTSHSNGRRSSKEPIDKVCSLLVVPQAQKEGNVMPSQQEQQPNGPTTGPLRPLIVVVESTKGDKACPETRKEEEDEQDRLPPVPEKHSTQQQQEQETESTDTPPAAPPRDPEPLALPRSAVRSRQRFPLLLLATSVGIVLILLGVAAGILLVVSPESLGPLIGVLPGLSPTASVTLSPQQEVLRSTVPITAVTGTPDPIRQQVSARLLSVKSDPFSQTVPTSGQGHTQARAAQGTLTFYNAAPYSQTVSAGTVLTGGDGVQVVTDQVAYLPAGNLPLVGIVTVAAHAVQVGPQGNISPLDLDGLCCVAGISVKNTGAFSGGQNARDYSTVAPQDVDAVAGPHGSTLTQQAQARLQGQVYSNEQLAGPAQCHPLVSTDHPVGSEAAHVTVSVRVTCQTEVYDGQAVQQVAGAALTEQARKSLGTGYSVQGNITTMVTQIATTEQAHGTLSLLVSVQGTWGYQFSSADISRLARQIAGMSRQDALNFLKRQEHVHTITITESWNASTIPSDPAHIQVMVLGVIGG